MKRSRRSNHNAVNAASLARWIVMTAFLALAGLSYVYLTLQLYHLGERKKAAENELISLRTQNDIASAQIAALTSRTALPCTARCQSCVSGAGYIVLSARLISS